MAVDVQVAFSDILSDSRNEYHDTWAESARSDVYLTRDWELREPNVLASGLVWTVFLLSQSPEAGAYGSQTWRCPAKQGCFRSLVRRFPRVV